MTLFFLISSIWLAATAGMVALFQRSPVGFQNEDGFQCSEPLKVVPARSPRAFGQPLGQMTQAFSHR